MKKLFAFILAFIYLSSTVGATIHLHYCMDKLVNWSLTDKDGDKCNKCGMQKNGGCCKDEHKFVKNNVDQKTAGSGIQLIQFSATPVTFLNITEFYSSLIQKYPLSHAPPIISGVDILIRNCIFRI